MLVGFFGSLSESQSTLCIYLYVKHSLHLPTLKTTGQSEQKTLDTSQPTRHLHVNVISKKPKNILWNLSKVSNKDIRTPPVTFL